MRARHQTRVQLVQQRHLFKRISDESYDTIIKKLTISSDESAIHFRQSLTAVLQRLSDIVGGIKLSIRIHEDIELDPDTVTGVVAGDTLEAIDDGREAIGQIHEFLLQLGISRLAGETDDVFETSACPVVDDVQGQKTGACWVQPPDIGVVADQGEEQRESVEVDVGFAILC